MKETPAEARLRRMIEKSWPGHGPCGWLVYSPERKHPSAIYDLEVTARGTAEHFGLECVAVVPTLTDAEREALELASTVAWPHARTLRGLLERTGGGK